MLSPNDEPNDTAFGRSVALSADGNTALIGADDADSQSGAAWVFTRTGSSWSQQGSKLEPNDATGPSALFLAGVWQGASRSPSSLSSLPSVLGRSPESVYCR